MRSSDNLKKPLLSHHPSIPEFFLAQQHPSPPLPSPSGCLLLLIQVAEPSPILVKNLPIPLPPFDLIILTGIHLSRLFLIQAKLFFIISE
jgi:hypothetical protein